MADITKIPLERLKKDLQDSRSDISTCEAALSLGIKNYSGGSVEKRLNANKHFVDMITKELDRRGEPRRTCPKRHARRWLTRCMQLSIPF